MIRMGFWCLSDGVDVLYLGVLLAVDVYFLYLDDG